jgi:3-oxoacyl-[acyl-carrier-protein] synthase-3
VYLHSIGHYWPQTILTNQFFNELDIGSSDTWIEDRTGIRERRSVLGLDSVRALRRGETSIAKLIEEKKIEPLASMCKSAWGVALERCSQVPSFDTVIGGTSIPDDDVPASGCTVASEVGIGPCQAFDVSSACSTFVVQSHVVRGLMQSRMAERVAVFCGERYTLRQDFSDRRSSILFGDCAIAAMFGAEPLAGSMEVLDTFVQSDPSGASQINIPTGRFFYQNGPVVQKFAVTKTVESVKKLLERNRLNISDIQYFIGHQANYRMLVSVGQRLDLPESKHLHNVQLYGNQGGAGAPSVLSMNWDKFKAGDLVAIAVVGAGLTWGGMLLRKT